MISQRRLLRVLFTFLSLFLLNSIFAQRVITGKVTNDKGVALTGATILVKGISAPGTKTDSKGDFSFTVPNEAKVLEISYTGHISKQVSIVGKSSIEVELQLFGGALDSVVVIGYTTQKRKDVTGAISSVKGEDVKNLPTQNVADALQGRVAGVEVIKASGEPGAKSQITIRGVSSLNQPDPLYIIDGVRSSGNNVNPQDIASYEVLKDASAAAIYGAAAAGGVILITTKQGRGATPTISFNSRYGITVPRLIKLLNKEDFVRYKKLTGASDYVNPSHAAQIEAFPDYDWVDALYQNGYEQNYNLSISGSTPSVNYYLSGVHNIQKGVFLDNTSTMSGARVNTDVKISKSIKIGEQINVWKKMTMPVKTSLVNTPFRTIPVGAATSDDPYNPWGTFPYGYTGTNVIAQIKTANFEFPEDNFSGNAYVEIKLPIKYMTFKTTVGFTSQNWQNNIFQETFSVGAGSSSGNHLYRNVGKYQQSLLASILAYDHTWGVHTLNLLAGYEQYANQSENLRTDVTNVAGQSYGYILTSNSSQQIAGGWDPNGLVKSVFGRLNYDFAKKMYATFTVRRDGNFTVFGPGNQYGIFPAVSAGWKINEEPFFRNMFPKFGLLKLRASYGTLGNSSIPAYLFTTTYLRIGAQNFNNGSPTEASYTQESFQNDNIKWESTHEVNIGLDGDLLNGRLYFSVDWYDKTTKDLLYGVPVPLSSGIPASNSDNLTAGTVITNIGSVRNRGVDIGIGYRSQIKDFKYSVSVAGSFNKNKIISLPGNNNNALLDGNNNYPGAGADGSIWRGQALTYSAVGYSFGQFYGYKCDGIYQTDAEAAAGPTVSGATPKAGDLIYRDITGPDGVPDGKIDALDKTIIGNAYPKFSYGVNINLNWKKWDLNMLWNGVAGVDLYNGVFPYQVTNIDGGNVTSKVFETSNFNGNGVTDLPNVFTSEGLDLLPNANGNYTNPSSFFVENGAYIKLKSIQLGYNVSGRFLEKLKIKNAKFYLMGYNVLRFTKYRGEDPEIGSQFPSFDAESIKGNVSVKNAGTTNRGVDRVNKYPTVRTFSFGIDLTF
ncbi:SusC/RagA family TonB-linked outer membrane protein [Ferruginibacter lapsinanis]|uniref:SusC/RagA family TonB-linked outer membrane protein n=1 Tax=Ferruginibacter lapsinanis TaxID=563172 RepID=UPI001E59539B|nr:SusC/RagA family TonB-linked outer membrane protein [Ferruginibacter lapsinanis]UEG49081.1 SusC/RagA family TonB-linked outer membrane protein [Ferruginibacter lapsinanis]